MISGMMLFQSDSRSYLRRARAVAKPSPSQVVVVVVVVVVFVVVVVVVVVGFFVQNEKNPAAPQAEIVREWSMITLNICACIHISSSCFANDTGRNLTYSGATLLKLVFIDCSMNANLRKFFCIQFFRD